MESPLERCSFEEQRSVIRFLYSEGVKSSEIYLRIVKQYGKSCMNRASFYKWINHFKCGRTSVVDEQRSGRPVEVSTPALECHIKKLINEDRRATIEEITKNCNASVGTVHSIIHNKLNYHKICTRWVPKQLMNKQKERRLQVCKELKERYLLEGDEFLERIVICDEIWIHYYKPESKWQSKEWKHSNSPPRKKFKAPSSTSNKVMLTIFWDAKGPISCDYTEGQRNITNQYYSDMLKNKVKPAIMRRRPGLQRKGVLLLQDNARPYTEQSTLETIEKLRWKILPHPPHSPDLTPLDFFLFGQFKEALCGVNFDDNEDVKNKIQTWLNLQEKDFFAFGIKKLVQQWDKCITVKGNYVEK